jgi:protoporphyrinogen oxidase
VKKIAILGGGAAGVVAAKELADRGASVDLFERQPELGGLHRSVSIGGDAFDIGAFTFSRHHALVGSFPELASLFLAVDVPQLSLTPHGTLDLYPFSVGAYVDHYGVIHTALAAGSLLLSKLRDRRRDSVARFAQYYVGRRLYRETGLRHYIERLYGVPDSEVGVEFAIQRLGYIRNSVRRATRSMMAAAFGGRQRPQDAVTKELVRPREGFAHLYSKIGEALARRGAGVHVNAEIRAIRRIASGHELILAEGARRYDHLVSTIPVPITLRLAGSSVHSRVEHIGLLSLFYRGEFLAPAAVLCNFTYEGRWKRICVFSRYYGRSRGADYLTVELTGSDLTPERCAELAAEFEEHSVRLGLFSSRPELVGSVVTPHAYPFFRPGHTENVRQEFSRLQELGIRSVGRQGSHQYLSSHDSVEQARELVRHIPIQ